MKLSKSVSLVPVVLFLLVVPVLLNTTAQAQIAAPHIFTSDLASGPATGGQNNQGAWVTLYGRGFGATQGNSSVTLGGVNAYRYAVWSDSRISFQIANSSATGNIVVTVSGVRSNPILFTVRAGRICFVSPTGSDTQKGTYAKPWRTLTKALSAMQAGDIVYALNGTAANTLNINRSGASGQPLAIVAYPNATVIIGAVTGQTYGITASLVDDWVLAGLTLRGTAEALELASVTNWRLAGNDISCPNGAGTAACVHATLSSNLALLANNIHDSGSTTSSDVAHYASVQLSSSNVEVGWNQIGNTRSCRALTFSGAVNQYGLRVHDNYIHDAVCDGISFDIDPSQGAVQAYNNVIQRVGTGPAPGGVEQSYACIAASGSGSGTIQISNNTLYDCGARGNNDSGAIAATTQLALTNNIISLQAGEQYVAPNTSTSMLSGSNDLFWGSGAGSAPFTNSLNLDPQFVDPASLNFSLQATSPAIDAGINTSIATDYSGLARPQGTRFDIGAYEFAGQAATTIKGQVTPDPNAVDFGTVTTGTSSTQSITVSNTGTGNTTITQMSATGAGFTATGLLLPLTLAPNQSASFTVTFSPQLAGTASGSVSLVSDAVNANTTVQLSGSATTPVGTLSASSTSLSFANVNVGSSASQTLTVTAATASVTISQAATTGTGWNVTGPMLPLTLAPGQSANFTVNFAPTTAGSVTGSLSIASNASNSPSTVNLSGTGASASSACPCSIWSSTAIPVNVDAGDAKSVELGLKFKSDVNGYITGIRFYKSTNNTGTHIGHLWTSTGTSLATATFINETASGWQQVNFSTPVAITAGSVYVASYYAPSGHYSDDQNYFATTGVDNGPLHALPNATSANGVYAYGSTSSFPNQSWLASNYWLDVVFTSSSSSAGMLAVSPGSLSFGSVRVGNSSSQSVTITASTASVTISQANVTGAGFTTSGLTLPATLAPGQSLSFTVKFSPSVAGTATGSISLITNASNSPATISLSGTGTSSHSATLTWTASTSTNVAGYYIYRATQSGGPFTKLNSTAVNATLYTDASVAAGTTYYYVLTTATGSGGEGPYSTQVSASIPTP